MKQSFLIYDSKWSVPPPPPSSTAPALSTVIDSHPLDRSQLSTPPALPPLVFSPTGITLSQKITYGFVRGIGAGLIGFSVMAVMFTLWPTIEKEFLYLTGKSKVSVQNSGFRPLIETSEAKRISRIQEEAKTYGLDSYFSIVIPKIGATSAITANVDTGDEDQYRQALLKGVAHAKGTYFPGQGKRIYLFAHSTDFSYNISRYNAVFYLLRKIEPGDKITLFFADRKYTYQVKQKVIVPAQDTSWLATDTDEEELVLQTCYPPGTTWKRLIVSAKLIGKE
ncbi:MAG: hypothetical protein UW73_C0009G0037 [Microgenomates group bacterium GW2011_GWB1_44_8]|nr:MAG: hypothetical protein UW73_C0009G0037 [Microgenomates group bacterium GW2011_GWB1_44_8]